MRKEWKKPTISEQCVGLEITAYAPADIKTKK